MTEAPPQLTPLDMARNLAASVQRYARQSQADQLSAMLNHTGEASHAAAQLAGNLALVSIAEDLHRVVGVMLGDAWRDPDPDGTIPGAVDDARRTRDHMAAWAAGTERHRGEEP